MNGIHLTSELAGGTIQINLSYLLIFAQMGATLIFDWSGQLHTEKLQQSTTVIIMLINKRKIFFLRLCFDPLFCLNKKGLKSMLLTISSNKRKKNNKTSLRFMIPDVKMKKRRSMDIRFRLLYMCVEGNSMIEKEG